MLKRTGSIKSGAKGILLAITEDVVKTGVFFIFSIIVIMMAVAVADTGSEGEAAVGSFEAYDYNDGWTLIQNGKETAVTLPVGFDIDSGREAVIINTLPDDITDGMSLMIRASMEDVAVYVDGSLRERYASDQIDGMSYYIPSAYVVAGLNKEDAGRDIRIEISSKARGVINGITIGYGNNVWFEVIRKALVVNLIAVVVLILGLLLVAAGTLFAGGTSKTGAPRWLGFLMMDIAMWVFSESLLRQFIFARPSLTQYFSYYTMELIGVLACMYFDEVQHKVYHKRYIVAEGLAFLQMLLNILYDATGVAELYETLPVSHLLSGVCAALVIVNIITDIIQRRIREYRFTAMGMLGFVVMTLVELFLFYVNRFRTLGGYVCTAMILLMMATVIQTVYDVVETHRLHDRRQTAMTINTIETIASAIDARDEYTGGHSERVGLYAGRLAREMAADYDLSEEDILRVQYIGLIHDIGKIGVADNVLNKAGRLTDEEFSLMKKHTEIGYEIMSSLGDGIDGLLDGIRYHHERFDGKGYPDGLSDTDIPLVARILCLADSYDAMTSNRVYRKRLTDDEVREEFVKCAGKQFDPALTEIFLRLIDRGELKAETIDGVASDGQGRVMQSAMLENRLQSDLLAGIEIQNPAHVRMLCYIIKLMEKKGSGYQVMLAGPALSEGYTDDELSAAWSILDIKLREGLNIHDVNIRYTKDRNVIALYGKSPEEADSFVRKITEEGTEAAVEMLCV